MEQVGENYFYALLGVGGVLKFEVVFVFEMDESLKKKQTFFNIHWMSIFDDDGNHFKHGLNMKTILNFILKYFIQHISLQFPKFLRKCQPP